MNADSGNTPNGEMFRVVSYNIRAGLGMDGRRSIRRVAEVLAPLSPDIVCLQEVDQHAPRSWLANQPKFLSVRLGMQDVFQRNVRFDGGGGFGNCILAKPFAQHCRCHPLPGDGEPRGLLEVTATVSGRHLTAFCTHLALEPHTRIEQARKVLEIVRSARGPRILCGDMNDVLGSRTLSILLDDPVLRDVALEFDAGGIATYPPGGGKRIDFVLADLALTVKSYEVVDSQVSDHLPLVVDFEFS